MSQREVHIQAMQPSDITQVNFIDAQCYRGDEKLGRDQLEGMRDNINKFWGIVARWQPTHEEIATAAYYWAQQLQWRGDPKDHWRYVKSLLQDKVLAYAFLEFFSHKWHISRLGVDPKHLANGVGTDLMGWIKRRLPENKKKYLTAMTRASSSLWYFEEGFDSTGSVASHFHDTGEALVCLQYTCRDY